ncbi:hypothetical protein LCGC14_0740940, partial [marine sediment metagenome]
MFVLKNKMNKDQIDSTVNLLFENEENVPTYFQYSLRTIAKGFEKRGKPINIP